MTQLVHLAYVSTSPQLLTDQCLEDLLASIRISNKEHGITGMLLYKGGTFLQVIEGLESDIDQLFLNIQQDSRNSGIIHLLKEPIEHRIFSEWSMGFQRVSSQKLDGFTELLSLISNSNLPSGAAKTLLLGFK